MFVKMGRKQNTYYSSTKHAKLVLGVVLDLLPAGVRVLSNPERDGVFG